MRQQQHLDLSQHDPTATTCHNNKWYNHYDYMREQEHNNNNNNKQTTAEADAWPEVRNNNKHEGIPHWGQRRSQSTKNHKQHITTRKTQTTKGEKKRDTPRQSHSTTPKPYHKKPQKGGGSDPTQTLKCKKGLLSLGGFRCLIKDSVQEFGGFPWQGGGPRLRGGTTHSLPTHTHMYVYVSIYTCMCGYKHTKNEKYTWNIVVPSQTFVHPWE